MSAAQPESPSRSGEGILYSAAGERYVAEALRSARSSLRHNRVPHAVFASVDAPAPAGVQLLPFEPSSNPYADKIANMRRSPFERTLYLDTDTYVVEEIAHLLKLLDRYDVAVAFTAEGRGPIDPDVPGPFYEFNTGVLAWRAGERTDAFLRDWQETYLRWYEQGDPYPTPGRGSRDGRADQLAFRRCAWEHDVHLFVLAPEYNFRLGYPAVVAERVRVIHGRHEDPEGLAARVNAIDGPRLWPPRLTVGEKLRRRLGRAVRPPARRV